MRPLYGALVLISTLFFNDIEISSGMAPQLKITKSKQMGLTGDGVLRTYINIEELTRTDTPRPRSRNPVNRQVSNLQQEHLQDAWHEAYHLHQQRYGLDYRSHYSQQSHTLSQTCPGSPVHRRTFDPPNFSDNHPYTKPKKKAAQGVDDSYQLDRQSPHRSGFGSHSGASSSGNNNPNSSPLKSAAEEAYDLYKKFANQSPENSDFQEHRSNSGD